MQRMHLGILVSPLVAGSAPQLAEAAGHGHARKTNHAPLSRRCRLATQMRHGCGLIRRLNGVQGMAEVKRDKRRPGISHKAFDNRPGRIALTV